MSHTPPTPLHPAPLAPCWKVPYPNRHEARAALRRIRDPKRRAGLHEYECHCGKWHLGGK